MDQKNSKKKIDEFCDLYDIIKHASKHGDYQTVKAATEMLTQIHQLFLEPRIVAKIVDPAYDPHGHPHEPLPAPDDYYDSYEGQWVKEYHVMHPGHSIVLPGGIDVHEHPEHQSFNRECEHEPVEVGFNFSKVVCKKCDKELPKEALYGKKTFQ